MRTVLFLCLLLATLAQAHDFSDISKPTVTLLDDGHYRFVHTTHHTFNNPNGNQTYFHLDATAEIHKQWNFIDLNDYAGAGGIAVAKICHEAKVAQSTISVVTKNATAKASLLTKLQKPHTIVKFTGLRCGGQAVFGHFDSIIPTPSNALQVKMELRQAQLHDVFRHAHIKMSTNHVHSRSFSPAEAERLLAQQREVQQVGPAPSTASRKMDTQWSFGSWFHHACHAVSHAVSHAVHHVEHAVSKAVHTVEHDVSKAAKTVEHDVEKAATTVEHTVTKVVHTVEHAVVTAYDHVVHAVDTVAEDVEHIAKQVEKDVYDEAEDLLKKAEDTVKYLVHLVEGDINFGSHTWTVASASHGPASLMLNPMIRPPTNNDVNHQTYTHFDLKVIFELDIHHYSLKSFKTAVEADVNVALALAATHKASGSKTYELCDIRLAAIDFSIGPVPVHIQPYIPISFRLDYSFDGKIQFGSTATGHIEVGIAYGGGHFSPINTHSFSLTKQWDSPQQTSLQVTGSVIPSLVLNIDFLGGPIVSLAVTTTMNLVESEEQYFLQFNGNIAPSLSAVFKLEVMGMTLLGPKTWGPHTFGGTSFNLGREKLPWLKVKNHTMTIQEETTTGSSTDAVSAEDAALVDRLGSKSGPVVGTTWTGAATASGSCASDQQVTFQMAGASETSLLFMAVIDISGTNPTTQQKAIANIIAPYYMTINDGNDTFAVIPGEPSACHVSSTAAWLSPLPPTFTARFTQTGDLIFSNQIGGEQLCTGAMTLSPDVFTSTAEVLAAAAGSAPADNSGGLVTTHQTIGIVIGGCVGVVLIAIAVGAIVSSRSPRRRTAPSNAADKGEQSVPLEIAYDPKEADTDLI